MKDKSKYDTNKKDLEKIWQKIPNVSSVVKKKDFNTKITEIKKITDITGLVITTNFNKKSYKIWK